MSFYRRFIGGPALPQVPQPPCFFLPLHMRVAKTSAVATTTPAAVQVCQSAFIPQKPRSLPPW
jgi:hypothetical protein